MSQRILQTVKDFKWQQWLLVVLFVFVLGFTGLQLIHTVHHARYWRHHHDEPIRAWMTVGYVAHSYRVPPHVLYEALGLQQRPDKRPLRAIAKSQNRSMEQIRSLLEDAIAQARQTDTPPPAPPVRRNEERRQ